MANILYKDVDNHDDIFHKEIVDTFFGKTEEKHAKPKSVVEKKSSLFKVYYKRFLITILSLLIASLFFYFGFALRHNKIKGSLAGSTAQDSLYSKLLSGGVIEKSLVESVSFEGDAKEKSKVLNNSIKLVNSERSGWARAFFDLGKPKDFSDISMLLLGKSSAGKKNVNIILADAHEKENTIYAIEFLPQWEWKNINLKYMKGFDFKNIQSISIEYGRETAGNTDGTIIYIKEIGLRKGGK